MANGTMPKIPGGSSGITDILNIFNSISPAFGTGKQTTSTSSTRTSAPDQGTLDQTDQLLKQIMDQSSSKDLDDMVANILTRAKQEFGPALISSKAAGMRGYSDSVVRQMGNEAMARATGEAAKAKLDAINANNRVAAGLVEAKLKATTSIKDTQTQVSKTGASPAGKGLSLAVAGAQLYSKMKGKPAPPTKFEDLSFGTPYGEPGDYAGTLGSGGFNLGPQNAATFSQAGQGIGDATLFGEEASELGLLPVGGTLMDAGVVETAISAPTTLTALGATELGPEAGAMGGEVAIDEVGATQLSQMVGADLLDFPEGLAEAMEAGEAIDSASTGATLSADVVGAGFGSAAVDFGADFAGDLAVDAAATTAAEGLGSYYFPGMYTVVNELTGGELTNTLVDVGMEFDSTAQSIFGSDAEIFTPTMEVAGEVIDRGTSGLESVVEGTADILTDFADATGCFITTAATQNGELDNGYTLSMLRQFRASYMQQTPERLSELIDYYLLAPLVVKRINASEHAEEIYEKIRTKFLIPAVAAYRIGLEEVTHDLYKDMIYWARQQVGLANGRF